MKSQEEGVEIIAIILIFSYEKLKKRKKKVGFPESKWTNMLIVTIIETLILI